MNVPFQIVAASPQQPQGPTALAEPPPARVRVALELLRDLTHKTATRAAANDVSLELIDGQALSKAEANAQATACNVLVDYMLGKLAPDFWEGRAAGREDSGKPGLSGQYIGCFACRPGPPQQSCVFCRGTGELLVVPVNAGKGVAT